MTNNGYSSHFASNFEFIKTLGKGGFGIVFKAKNKIDEKSYAVKRVKFPADQNNKDKVLSEVKALAKLDDVSIVKYLGAWPEMPPHGWQEEQDNLMRGKGLMPEITESSVEYTSEASSSRIVRISQDDEENSDSVIKFEDPGSSLSSNSSNVFPGFLYIQMELCREDTLKEFLAKTSYEQRKEHIQTIQEHIVRGIDYIHKKGLIHRDLKPSNIFFSLDGSHVKIGDFGLVKYTGGNVASNNPPAAPSAHTKYVGTTFYMSPEQKAGLPYSNKIDIYSCGLIFFELLSNFNTESEKIKELKKAKESDFVDHPFESFKSMLKENPDDRPTIDMVGMTLIEVVCSKFLGGDPSNSNCNIHFV